MFHFDIQSVERYSADTVRVVVTMIADVWKQYQKLGHLGQLYGVDVSNEVYRSYGVKAYNPTVADRDKASGGVKTITLYYADADWKPKQPGELIKVDFQSRKRIA